jgi:hypothetical protein
VRREGKARRLKGKAARRDPLVKAAQRAMRIERKHDDVGLHEAHRCAEPRRDRCRALSDWHQGFLDLFDANVEGNGPDAR